jgi:hypothetical protein
LTRATDAETEVPVPSTTPQSIDVFCVPNPQRETELTRMGLLGELVDGPTMFEPFHDTPSLRVVRSCLRKQHNWQHQLELWAEAAARTAAKTAAAGAAAAESTPEEKVREEPPGSESQVEVPLPLLVIISPGRPETVLREYECRELRPGVYHTVPGLRWRLVVLVELPRTPETLLLRLLGKGRMLREALDDLKALPDETWEKSIAEPLLLHFQLKAAESATGEEDEVSAEIQAWYEDYQRKQQKLREDLREEAHKEGRAEEAARNVLTVLRARGVAVPKTARQHILAQKDPKRLERWLKRASVATSVAEVLDEPS